MENQNFQEIELKDSDGNSLKIGDKVKFIGSYSDTFLQKRVDSHFVISGFSIGFSKNNKDRTRYYINLQELNGNKVYGNWSAISFIKV